MPLPPELTVPPPRDPAAARRFLAKTKKKAIGIIIGGGVAFPLLVVIFMLSFDAEDVGLAVGISVGISTLIELMGLALLVNSGRSLKLFVNGIAVLGRVRSVTAPPDRQGNAYVFVEIEFQGGHGRLEVGKVASIGNVSEIDTKPGQEVAVLYSVDNPRQFAVYTPGMGMMVGRTDAARPVPG